MDLAIPRTTGGRLGLRHPELVLHLVKRELSSAHRFTVLGWAWPLARQLAQLAVLVFVFSSVLDLGIPDFPVYVFSGLVAWNAFSTGLSAASTSLIDQRHLVFQPRLPAAVLPVVAVVVPFVDVLMAAPVLLLMLIVSGELHATAFLFPLVLGVQLVLMIGLAWLLAPASVYVRDVPNLVALGLMVLFYLTPVFYSLHRIPEQYEWLLQLNPMTTLLDLDRALLLGLPYPSVAHIVGTVALAAVLAVAGWYGFERMRPGLVDNL
ncbi:ABC transporter permease [Conexibacter woesei]|uniref:ABC transporter permease n=1 Tax=Conexibacter woesei TaxID=191495 RepID=UPI0018CB545A|nr:ABC transporter permease [Conexibacter woesei]